MSIVGGRGRGFAPQRNPVFRIRHPDGTTVHEHVLRRQPHDPGDNDAWLAWRQREFDRIGNHYAHHWRTVPLMHQCCGAEEQVRVRYDRDGNFSPESQMEVTVRIFAHWYSCDA